MGSRGVKGRLDQLLDILVFCRAAFLENIQDHSSCSKRRDVRIMEYWIGRDGHFRLVLIKLGKLGTLIDKKDQMPGLSNMKDDAFH